MIGNMLKKLLNSYWFKSGSLTLINRIAITLFGLLNFFFLVRILSKNDMGIWVIFLSILALSESIRNAFIYNPLLRYLNSAEEKDRRDIITASLVLNLLAALIIAVVFIILAFSINYLMDAPQMYAMFLVSIISVFGFTLFAHFNFLQQANLRFGGTVVSTMTQKGSLFLYILYVYIFDVDTSLLLLAIVYSVGYVLSSIIAFFFTREESELHWKFDMIWVNRLFHYGKYTLGTNISTMLNKSTREWFLGGMIGNSAAAIFAPSVRVTNLFEIPLGAIASIFYPEMINRVSKEGNSAAKYMYEKSVGVIIIAVVPAVVLIYLLAEQIVLIIAGPDYPESIPVLQVMAIYGVFEPFQRQFGVTLNAIGKARINFYFIVISSTVGIIFTYIFIDQYGVMGAAYSTLITYALSAIIIQYILYKQIGVNTANIFKYGLQSVSKGVKMILNR